MIPISDRASRALTLPKLAGLIMAAATLGAMAAQGLGAMGFEGTTTGAKITRLRTDLDSVGGEVGTLRSLVEASTTKQCLDAEEDPAARRNLARAGVPCEQLYRQRGLRP